MLLTAEQLAEIRQIIEDHHNAFVANVISPDALQKEVLEQLKKKGLIDVKVDSLTEAYLYGQILAQMETAKAQRMTYDQFRAHVKKSPVALTTAEKNAIALAQSQAGQYCRGLGNRVNTVTGDIMIEADQALRARMEATIRDKTAEALIRRETVQKLKSEIGWETGDWARDLDRIAATELQNATELGHAQELADEYGDDVLVSRVPNDDACPKCKELFLDSDGQPKIFRLSTLLANGTNVGLKQADWKPVAGTVHPWCKCTTTRVPPGWGWEDGDLVPGIKAKVHGEEDLTKALSDEAEHEHHPLAGRTTWRGMPIAIETKAGQTRHWTDQQGNTGSTKMLYDYGYIEGTRGCDEDEIDVFIGPNPNAEHVYVCHQQNPATGIYDEEKIMCGWNSEEEAAKAYLAHYTDHDFLVAVSVMGVDQFKRWVSHTFPAPDEMASGAHELKLVIPIDLKKTRVPTEIGGQSPDAANRAPGSGTVPNILFNVPHRPVQGPTQQLVLVLKDPSLKENRKHAREAMTRDPRIWNFDEPAKRRVIGFDPGDHVVKYLKAMGQPGYDPEEQKKRLKERGMKNVGYRNKPISGTKAT